MTDAVWWIFGQYLKSFHYMFYKKHISQFLIRSSKHCLFFLCCISWNSTVYGWNDLNPCLDKSTLRECRKTHISNWVSENKNIGFERGMCFAPFVNVHFCIIWQMTASIQCHEWLCRCETPQTPTNMASVSDQLSEACVISDSPPWSDVAVLPCVTFCRPRWCVFAVLLLLFNQHGYVISQLRQ